MATTTTRRLTPRQTIFMRLAAPAVALLLATPAATSQESVATTGGAVRGSRAGELTVFRGLPYAAAPVGERRWRAPESGAPWPGVREANAFGPACPQDRAVSVDQAGDPGSTSEDCLFLNVWTPSPGAGAKLPVMVWIHGGAFVIGAGSQKLYDGAALARRGVVVVTFNYRLGALGFFAHPALAAAGERSAMNFGLLDQIAALRWVQENISALGGDPGNVTVFGESAGAQSVLALFTSPLARGLFHKGIAQSAYGIPSHTRAKARAVGAAIATAAGLDGARATVAELRDLPAERLVELATGKLTLSPSLVVGDAALPEPILAAFQRGAEADLPLVIGNNSDEASVAVAFGIDPAALVQRMGAARIAVRPLYPRGLDDAALGRQVVTDVVFGAYARRIAWLHAARAPTWRYYYNRVPENMRSRLPGVPHGGEVADVFGLDDDCGCLGAPLTDADRGAARRVGDYWSAFARDGVPAAAGAPPWPRDSRARFQTMVFDDVPVVRVDFTKRRLNTFIGALNVLEAMSRR